MALKSEDPLLSVIAGYVDTLSFVSLFGLFTAHVTGNFVLIGAGAAGYSTGVFLKLMVFPAFIAGVALSSMVVRSLPEARATQGARLLYAIQAALMFVFCVAGQMAMPVAHAGGGWVLAAGMLGALAMGVQNAHSRLIQRPGVPNTVMTGNVTQAILDAVDLLLPGTDSAVRVTAHARLLKMLPAIVAFAIGAMGGAFGYRYVGFLALLLPCVLLVWLACTTGAYVRMSATPSKS